MTKHNNLITLLVLSVVNIVMEIIGLVQCIKSLGVLTLVYYTEQSNIILMFVSVLVAVWCIKSLVNATELPKWVHVANYLAVSLTTVTFLVVVFILTPQVALEQNNWWGSIQYFFFSDSVLYHHLLCPILGIVEIVFVERNIGLTIKHTLLALIYTALYAVVMLIINFIIDGFGPYFFLYVYRQPWYMTIVWGVVVIGFAYLIAWLLKIFNGKRN